MGLVVENSTILFAPKCTKVSNITPQYNKSCKHANVDINSTFMYIYSHRKDMVQLMGMKFIVVVI